MRLNVFVILLWTLGSPVMAGFEFTFSPRTVGPYLVGSTVAFDVIVATDGATVTDVAGVTFFLGLDDPDFEGGKTSGGQLSIGTNDSSTALGSGKTYLFPSSENVGGFLNSNNSFLAFSASAASSRSVTSAGALLGSFQLDFTNATQGTHTLSVGFLDLINVGGATLPGPFVGTPLTLSVTAAPEPTCLVLVPIAALGLQSLRNRKKRDRRNHNPKRKRLDRTHKRLDRTHISDWTVHVSERVP